MQILGPHSRPTESETWGLKTSNFFLYKPSKWFWCTLKLENYCHGRLKIMFLCSVENVCLHITFNYLMQRVCVRVCVRVYWSLTSWWHLVMGKAQMLGPCWAEALGRLYVRIWALESHVHGFRFLLCQILATWTQNYKTFLNLSFLIVKIKMVVMGPYLTLSTVAWCKENVQ